MAFFLSFIDMTTALVFIVVFLFVSHWISTPGDQIPGPFALPFIGNLPMFFGMRQRLHIELLKLKEIYGDVFRVYVGPYKLIIISGYDNIHHAFVKHGLNFSHRPNWLPNVKSRAEIYGYGIVWGDGDEWRRLRRFALQSMRDFGVGKKSLEEIILEEAKLLVEEFAAREGQPINDVKRMMTSSISNVIHHVTFGFRYPHDDETFLRVIKLFDEVFKGPGPLVASLPKWCQIGRLMQVNYTYLSRYPHDDETFLRVIKLFDEVFKGPGPLVASLPKWCQIGRLKSSIKRSREAIELLTEYVTEQIADHEKTYDGNNIRDFIDLYIQAQRAEAKDNGKQTVHHLFRVILDLFSAGTETTATSLDWALLYMIEKPEIQQKCFKQIEKSASMSLPHMTNEDVQIAGYCIPKHTIVMGFLTTSHLDPKYFPEPRQFRPGRFIDDVTGTIAQQDQFIPFSLGPRACPGESLAKTEMFLVFSNLIQKFRFSKVSVDDVLDFSGITGITTCASPYRLKVESQHD
eukprot:XP_019923499.1 PREDICTED: cytochrome P450 2H2 [Crassostrea gigas]